MQTQVISKKGKNFWGEPIWTTFHIFGATYTPEKKDDFLDFIRVLPGLLPCPKCGAHFRENTKKFRVERYLKNNHDAFFMTYLMHDAVNKAHNHEVDTGVEKVDVVLKYSPPYEEVKSFYFRSLSEDCKACQGE